MPLSANELPIQIRPGKLQADTRRLRNLRIEVLPLASKTAAVPNVIFARPAVSEPIALGIVALEPPVSGMNPD